MINNTSGACSIGKLLSEASGARNVPVVYRSKCKGSWPGSPGRTVQKINISGIAPSAEQIWASRNRGRLSGCGGGRSSRGKPRRTCRYVQGWTRRTVVAAFLQLRLAVPREPARTEPPTFPTRKTRGSLLTTDSSGASNCYLFLGRLCANHFLAIRRSREWWTGHRATV